MSFLQEMGRSILARFVSISFVILIVLPTTAPFQAVGFGEIFGGAPQHSVESLWLLPLRLATRKVEVSDVPSTVIVEGRLKTAAESCEKRTGYIPVRWVARPRLSVLSDPHPDRSPGTLRI